MARKNDQLITCPWRAEEPVSGHQGAVKGRKGVAAWATMLRPAPPFRRALSAALMPYHTYHTEQAYNTVL